MSRVLEASREYMPTEHSQENYGKQPLSQDFSGERFPEEHPSYELSV